MIKLATTVVVSSPFMIGSFLKVDSENGFNIRQKPMNCK